MFRSRRHSPSITPRRTLPRAASSSVGTRSPTPPCQASARDALIGAEPPPAPPAARSSGWRRCASADTDA